MDKLVVFLDSNEYKRCGHNFSSTPMRKLQELADKNVIRLLSTTVVNGEVSEHIREDVDTFLSAQKTLARKAGAVRNIADYCDIIRKIDSDDIKQKAQQAFSNFIESTHCEILSCNGINNDALLGDYFSKHPPFEERVDKAAEFKDAFISYTLKRYAEENDIRVKVVSADKGFCASLSGNDRFQVFENSEELFSYITRIEEISRQNAMIIQSFVNQKDVFSTLTDKIEDAILSAGVWVEDAEDDCDIVNVEVKNICLSYIDDIEEHMITAHFDVIVLLTVDYSCIDGDNSYWDKEEGAYLFLATSELRIIKELQLDFCMTLAVDDSDEGQIRSVNEVEEIIIEEDTRYGIRIEPEDGDQIEVLQSSLDENEDEEYVPGAYTTCPACGRKINFENDGGNGFCIHCTQNQ